MKVRVTCQSCYEPFMVTEEKVGRKVRCSQCGEATVASAGGRRASKGSGGGIPVPMAVGGGVAIAVVAVAALLLMRPAAAPPGPIASAQVATQPVALQPSTGTSSGTAVPISTSSAGGAMATPISTTPVSTTPVATTPAVAAIAPAATPSNPTPVPAPTGEMTASASGGAASTEKPVAKPGDDKVASSSTDQPKSETDTAKSNSRKSDFDLPTTTKLELPELIKRVEPSVVVISTSGKDGGGQGSGFVIDKDGTVVTNVHVIRGASKATVRLADGTKGEITGIKLLMPTKDIAIVTVDLPRDKLHPLPVSKLIPDKGISTAAFGAPIGLSFTASEGIISSIRPADELEMTEKTEGMWLQTTSPISPGNSGGPLVDMFGSVVGMNTMQYSIGQNLNFAISSKDIHEAIEAAPDKSKPLDSVPELQEKPSIAQQRLAAKNEIGTIRGQKLLAGVTEIFPINMARYRAVVLDPTGNIWGRIVQRSEAIVEKCGIDLSFVDDPSADASVMLVHLDLKRSRKGGRDTGTQELVVRAELIVFDNEAEKRVDKLNIVWKNEMVIGTISAQALATGNFPRGASENLTKFFATFQTAYTKAVRETKKTNEDKASGKTDDDKKDADKKDPEKEDSEKKGEKKPADSDDSNPDESADPKSGKEVPVEKPSAESKK